MVDIIVVTQQKRREKIRSAWSRLSAVEQSQLTHAACHESFGGAALFGAVRSKAVEVGLAFQCTGRLRPLTYDLIMTMTKRQQKPYMLVG